MVAAPAVSVRWGGISTFGCSGGTGFDDEFLAEEAECCLDAGHSGAMARVEHTADGFLVDAKSLGEGDAGQAAVAKREGESGLGCGGGGDGDMMFSGAPCARYRDSLGVVDASSDRLLEGVGCLGQGFGFESAGGQALGQIAERDDEFAGGVGAKASGIGESHGGLLLGSPKVVVREGQLTGHRRQETRGKLFATILNDGLAGDRSK